MSQRKTTHLGDSPAVQWLGLKAFTAEGAGSIPGQGTRILQAHGVAKKTPQQVAHLVFGALKCYSFLIELN